MVKKLLVTTALFDSNENEFPILFLGEWCRLYSKQKELKKIDFSILPYHWDDRTKFERDYKELIIFYEQTLIDISNKLNLIHNVNHSLRYWRILVGPWLGYFIQILYDRWYMIQQAQKSPFQLSTNILLIDDEQLIPNDMSHFLNLITSDEWNHFIYACAIDKNVIKCKFIEAKGSIKTKISKIKYAKKAITNLFITFYNWLLSISTNSDGVLLINTYLSLYNLVKLTIRFRQLPVFFNLSKPIETKVNLEKRNWKFNAFDKKNDFEKYALTLIPMHIPRVYLEGYTNLLNLSYKMPWPRTPNLIFTSNSHCSDEIFKLYCAENIEKNSKLVIGQHGGHYGIGKLSFEESHEVKISDLYLSWGWKSFKNKVRPIGMLNQITSSKKKRGNKKGMLIITSVPPRYSYVMFSAVLSSQWIEDFENQSSFLNKLSKQIINNVTIRLYKNDYGWDQYYRWYDLFPNIKYDFGANPLRKKIQKYKLIVCTYNATTLIESLAMNIPTVIFWKTNHWELRDSAIPFFDQFKKVGIFHETFESAAQHINNIWENIEDWWISDEVVSALSTFCKNYGKTSNTLIDDIELELRDIMKQNL